MYNEEQKMEYINDSLTRNENAEIVLKRIFKMFQDKEEKFGKDICDFTVRDILETYRLLFTASFFTIDNLNSQLKIYTDWCLQNSLVKDCQNHYEEITKAMIKNCLNNGLIEKRVMTKNEILNIISQCNARDKVVIYSIFDGIIDEELESIRFATKDDIDFEKRLFTMKDGSTRKISIELINIIQEALEEDGYIDTKGKYREYLPECYNHLIKCKKGSKNEWISYRTCKFILSEAADNMEFTYGSLKESGRINMIKELMKEKEYKSIEECIFVNRDEIQKRYGIINSIKTYSSIYDKYIRADE